MPEAVIPINLAIQSYKSRSSLASSERLVNMYAEPLPQESTISRMALFPTPGLTVWKELQQFNPMFGLKVMGDFLYAVCGVTVYKINFAGDAIVVGEMPVRPDRVMMVENGIQLTILTSSGRSYYYDSVANTFSEITSLNYELSTAVTNLDNYTIFAKRDSQKFFISNNRQTETYDALDFASAEAESDNLVAILNFNRQLILMGSISTEFWQNTGNGNFPFQRIDGALIKMGTAAKFTAISDVTGSYWLGNDRVIYRLTGYSPSRISTFGLEAEIDKYVVINDAFAFIYTQEGHRFYCITFPTEKKTWVYDITLKIMTGQDFWHERESINVDTNQISRWLPNCHESFNGLELVGDYNTGIIYKLDLENYTENGTRIFRKVISTTQSDNYNRDVVNSLVVLMDTGVGIDGNGQGINPEIMMRTSKDGGKTWSTELTQPIGPIGEYLTEVIFNQVDWGRSLIIELRLSDPVKFNILGVYLRVTQGTA